MTPERERRIRKWVAPPEADLSYFCPPSPREMHRAISELLIALDAERAAHEELRRRIAGYRLFFDGPPGPGSPRFVEMEDADGYKINAGTWRDCGDGYWEWRILP